MNFFRNIESRLQGLFEGTFNRAFSSEVQPVELARTLAREMDSHKTASVSRVYVPNEYTVHLSEQDREKIEGYERSLEQELAGYLLDHARRREYDLLTRPSVKFNTDDRLRLGEFGIEARLVKPPAREGAPPSQVDETHTAVYRAAPTEPETRRTPDPPEPVDLPRAVLELDGQTRALTGPRVVLGRSADADCPVDDPNVSRRHAELRQRASGSWEIVDLNSTNGIKVNGRRVASSRLQDGDRVTIGTTTFGFGTERR
ncbi:MAG: FHA domain-containing protein [Solirubrobacterales bacterium]|nr:FHA domain-containing protein [Solirubrobacterales bacterium]